MNYELLKLAVTGALAGAANGFLGAGGGLIAVPLLAGWIGVERRKAFATSLALMLPLSAVSAAIYLWKGETGWSVAWPYLAGGLAGGTAAGLLFRRIPVIWLRRAMGILLLYGGVRMII